MDLLVENPILRICSEMGFEGPAEAAPAAVESASGIAMLASFSGRRFDFVIHAGVSIFPIWTDFYGASGSKLKAVAGSPLRPHSRRLFWRWTTS
jgi:hypothetical protein